MASEQSSRRVRDIVWCWWRPAQVTTDHHQPYTKAVRAVLPEAEHIRTGLHRTRGETTTPIERSHVFTRGRLSASRGVKALARTEGRMAPKRRPWRTAGLASSSLLDESR